MFGRRSSTDRKALTSGNTNEGVVANHHLSCTPITSSQCQPDYIVKLNSSSALIDYYHLLLDYTSFPYRNWTMPRYDPDGRVYECLCANAGE